MAAVVPFASCYAGAQRVPRGSNYMSLLTHRGPRCTPRPRLKCHTPKMTLWQICCLLKVMKEVGKREAAASRKQGPASPSPPSPGTRAEKKCIPSCLRHKRCIKRAG